LRRVLHVVVAVIAHAARVTEEVVMVVMRG